MNGAVKIWPKHWPGPAKQPVVNSASRLAQQMSITMSHLHLSGALPRTCRCGTDGVWPRASYRVHSLHEVNGRCTYSPCEHGGGIWCCRKRVTKVADWWKYVHFGSSQENLFYQRGLLIQGPPLSSCRQKTQLPETLSHRVIGLDILLLSPGLTSRDTQLLVVPNTDAKTRKWSIPVHTSHK